jgi:hypothetical protein
MSHAGFVYPLARPCIIEHPPPRVDIINDGKIAIFSGAMQFRVPLPRIRLSIRRSLNSPPRSRTFPSPSPPAMRARSFISLSRARARVILYTFRSSRSADQSAEKRAFSLRSMRLSRLMSARIALNASQRA